MTMNKTNMTIEQRADEYAHKMDCDGLTDVIDYARCGYIAGYLEGAENGNDPKIADLKTDKKQVESEISKFIEKKLDEFTKKYGIEVNLDMGIRIIRGNGSFYVIDTRLLFNDL